MIYDVSILTLRGQRKKPKLEVDEPSADQKPLASEDGDEPPFGVDLRQNFRRSGLSSTSEQLKLKTMSSLVSISRTFLFR